MTLASAPPATGPAVSIVLVSWNAADVIQPCLEALARGGHDVVVVDNASRDGSADLVATTFPWVRLLRLDRNRGFAGGVNAGVRETGGQYVLLLNCDAVSDPGAVERLATVLGGTPGCAAVGGCLVGGDGSQQDGFHVRRFPTLATWMVDLWLIDKLWPGNPVTRRYLALDQTVGATAPVDVDQPAAACLMVRRDVFDALGGMDERFHPAWFEDVDLCRRIRAAGWRVLFVPDARFRHRGGEAMRALGLGPFSRIWYRNLQLYVRKHHGAGQWLACKALVASGMALRVVVSVVRRRWPEAGAYAQVALDTVSPTGAFAR